MRVLAIIAVFTAGLFQLIGYANAQTCATSAPAPGYPPSQILASTLWTVLWEGYFDNRDYLTSPSYSEYSSLPGIGQTFYVPSSSTTSGQVPLYRLYDGSIPDHMTSTVAGEGGYTTEETLGYPYTSASAIPGLRQIARYLNGSGDHLEAADGLTFGGYTEEGGQGVYGVEKYLTYASYLEKQYSGGGITEQSDLAAGGAIYSWTWNGIQFINTHDHGRYIQSAFFFKDNANQSEPYNPTEGGDESAPALNHGSPIAESYFQMGTGTQITRAVPEDYISTCLDENGQTGLDQNHVQLYQTTLIGKNLTLGWNGMSQVALYQAHIVLPNSVLVTAAQVPVAFLQPQFNQFYFYNPSGTGTLTLVQSGAACNAGVPNNQYFPPTGQGGGVIISTSDHTAAMGFYAVPTAYSVHGFLELTNFLSGTGKCSGLDPTAVMDLNLGATTIPAGDNAYNVWIITGALTTVTSLMNTLAAEKVQ